MANISINIQEPYYSLILQGKKTVEGRLNKDKFATIRVGDILELEPEKIKFVIDEKNVYKNFRAMLKKEGIANVVPDKNSIGEAVAVYYKFYTKEQEREFGVVAIKIHKI
jgi:ASC-1-like (ASCH) protein